MGVASYQSHTRMEGMAAAYEQQAGNELQQAGDILKNYQDKQDNIVALDAVNRLKEASINLAQDPDNGYTNVKGNAVVGPQFVKQYQDRFEQQQGSIANSLANDNQRSLFAQHAEVVGLSYQSDLLHHQAKETQVFNTQTRSDTIDLAMKDIAAHPYDDQTYDKNAAIAGQAVVAQGKDMGLEGQALADYTKDKLSSLNSKALAYRTQSMAQDNPMLASDFFHKHELEFDPQTRIELGQHLKTTTDAQITRLQGKKIVDDEIASRSGASASFVPQDFKADYVKPFNQDQISQYVDAVKKPSPYDKLINEAATKYNISPTELKLRAVVESSLNPNADNGKGAVGLMGFNTDTAKQFGIDPKDPAQSIDGAARLMAAAGGTLGGDMSKVDKTYYGGSPTAVGKNTEQYAENMRAVRAQLYGGNQTKALTLADIEASEGSVIKKAELAAGAYRPGDAVLKDQMVTEALKNLNQQKQIIQNQNNASVQSILGEVQNGASSVSTLSPEAQKAYSQLPPSTQMQIDAKLKKVDNDPSFGAERYYTLSSMAANPETRAQFQNLDLTKELGNVSSHYWNQLVSIQNSMTKQDAKQLDKDMNFSKMQRDTLVMLKPYLDSLGKNKQLVDDTKAQFYGRLQEAEQQFHDDPKNGRWPTTPERQKMAASLLTQVTTPSGHWYSSDKTVPAFQANDLSNATVQINKNDKPILQQAFQDVNGRVPNDDELTKWHTQLQQQAYKSTGQFLQARDLANLYKQYAARQKAKQPASLVDQIPK
jgi:hypothetical protein